MSGAIWAMLEMPSSACEIRDVLAEAFPDTDRARIENDVVGFVTRLGRAGLIAPA